MSILLRRIIDAFKRTQPDDMAELRALADAVLAHQFSDFAQWWQFWLRSREFDIGLCEFRFSPWPDDAAGELIEEWRAAS